MFIVEAKVYRAGQQHVALRTTVDAETVGEAVRALDDALGLDRKIETAKVRVISGGAVLVEGSIG